LGLLQGSFRPDAEVRSLVRYRAELIERRAPHINHMIQALKHMNIQLNLVLSDITGATGERRVGPPADSQVRRAVRGLRRPEQLYEVDAPVNARA
jgi:hypothetical protein